MDEVAIRVSGVSKNFRLPHQNKSSSIKSLFINPLSFLGGKSNKVEVQHALKDISFEIKKGEFFGIVGRNGSGKSTLLKILAGIYQPTKGKVETKGKLVPFIELGVGFNPELSGRENVYLNGALLGFTQKQVEAKYNDIVAFAELERFMDQKLKNYSSGMQVRLAFSVATVLAESDILLIDEVLAVGDADFQRKCFEYFKSLKKNKKTVVFVSHDMGAIEEFCDRAVLIENNKIKNIGKTTQIAEQYAKLFLETEINKLLNVPKVSERQGNGAARVETISLDKGMFTDKDKSLRLSVMLKVFQPEEDVMTGFRVRTATGQSLFDTNTWIEKKDLPTLQAGEKCKIVWELPNFYTDGTYTIDAYVYGKGGRIMLDNWNEVLTFQVKRPDARGFLVKVSAPVSIEKRV